MPPLCISCYTATNPDLSVGISIEPIKALVLVHYVGIKAIGSVEIPSDKSVFVAG